MGFMHDKQSWRAKAGTWFPVLFLSCGDLTDSGSKKYFKYFIYYVADSELLEDVHGS